MSTHPSDRRPGGSPPPSVPITKGQKVLKDANPPPGNGGGDGSSSSGCSLWTFAPPAAVVLAASLIATGVMR